MNRKRSKRYIVFFLALTYALGGLFPVQAALALRDCGEHEVVVCETHEGEHFVARHISVVSVTENGPAGEVELQTEFPLEQHDASHQIERDSPALSSAVSAVSSDLRIGSQAQGLVPEIAVARRLRSDKLPNGPPSVSSYSLTFLPTIRIQV